MDYYRIGQRIRKYRKIHSLSQEELAERVNISPTHMSHIETGNTKLSLPVLVELASALGVCTDDLLHDAPQSSKSTAVAELSEILDKCSRTEAKFITDIIRTIKLAMEKHLQEPSSNKK